MVTGKIFLAQQHNIIQLIYSRLSIYLGYLLITSYYLYYLCDLGHSIYLLSDVETAQLHIYISYISYEKSLVTTEG